jgi:DNA-binding CsgD family transcriptional regulator
MAIRNKSEMMSLIYDFVLSGQDVYEKICSSLSKYLNSANCSIVVPESIFKEILALDQAQLEINVYRHHVHGENDSNSDVNDFWIMLNSSVIAVVSLNGMPPQSDASKIPVLLQEMAPHFAQACRLRAKMLTTNCESEIFQQILNALPYAVFIVGSKKGIFLMNNAAKDIVNRCDGISIQKNKLVLSSCNDEFHKLVRQMIQSSLANDLNISNQMLVQRKSSQSTYFLVIWPLPSTSGLAEMLREGITIVAVADPEHEMPDNFEQNFRQLYSVNPVQAKLAALITSGKSIKEAAVILRLSEQSARKQVKILLHKTNSRRQSDLIRTVLTSVAVFRPV